jgi:hypothetical protein
MIVAMAKTMKYAGWRATVLVAAPAAVGKMQADASPA